jgi:hypothetical protein
MHPTLKAPGNHCLKLQYELLSRFAFDFNLRRYTVAEEARQRKDER